MRLPKLYLLGCAQEVEALAYFCPVRASTDLAASQSPTSTVRLFPPRSGVTQLSRKAALTAARSAAVSVFQPRNSSIIAEVRTEPNGLAIPFPAIFGAEPCTGSNSEVLPGWMFPEGARPSPPASCAPRSLMMSPKRLHVTMTSNWLGSRTISIASVSMYKWRESTSAYSWRTCLKTRCQRSWAKVMALDLSLMHTRFRSFLRAYAYD